MKLTRQVSSQLDDSRTSGCAEMSPVLAVLCLLLLQTRVNGFGIIMIFKGNSLTHQDITERAIFETTLQVCRDVARAEGKDFVLPPVPYTATSVALACQASKSSKRFQQVVNYIRCKNWQVDTSHPLNGSFHCDNELLLEGRDIIKEGLQTVKSSNREENFEVARENLGKLLHTLQDFYSHSNWVELGNTIPNSKMIQPKGSIGNLAGDRETCRSCDGDCTNNILQDIQDENIIISGYYGLTKPAGKCSHGGFKDPSSYLFAPRGGINKDDTGASHGRLHRDAANLAIAATSELLENVRDAAGDKQFLQMMGISKGSKALSFVIDTTGSMSDDIAAVRTVTSFIINSKVGTEDEPSVYILVPFNDPGFGPLIRTTDPEVFKKAINSLTATGGGDAPEMSLSGLRLALTGSPPNSEIFLFTDAGAKDISLKNTVKALIERTKSVVNFMITGFSGSRRRRQGGNNEQQQSSRLGTADAQLYKELAQASGGQDIEVSKSDLQVATSIITESASSSLVTLLQAARSPGKAENFTVTVDESVQNLTLYITGRSVTITLISPSGMAQESTNTAGSLITASQSVGNFKTLKLKREVGLWEIRMASTNPYNLKVVGESLIDFLFDFLEVTNSTLGEFNVVENRPRAGVNGSMLMTLTGSDSATVTGVTLVESSGSGTVNGSVEAQSGRDFLIRFDRIPSQEFVVLVKGQNNGSSRSSLSFQRQSTINIKASSLTVTVADTNNVLVPGTPLSIPFTVKTNGTGGNFTIQATNDKGFALSFPSILFLEIGGSADGTVDVTAPLNTTSGTDVTLTIEAEAPGGTDNNYVVQRFTVLKTVTDFSHPVCELLSLKSSCSENCNSSMWQLSVQVTDGAEGTGVGRVSLKQGNGTMNTSLAENTTLVSYNASCCSPDVEFLVVDRVGNVGSCSYTVQRNSTPSPTAAPVVSLSTKAVQSFLLCFSITILGFSFQHEMGINVFM